MVTLDSTGLVRLLAQPDRRRVAAALILRPANTGELVAATDLDVRTVTDAVSRLVAGGLVEQGGDGQYVLLEAAFEQAARHDAPPQPASAHPDEPAEVARVLDQAFAEGRLVHLPTKRSKRLIVLDQLAQRFEPGRRYTERQVNASLAAIDDDVAALRRYLVDEGFLDRANGEYWRSGGSVI